MTCDEIEKPSFYGEALKRKLQLEAAKKRAPENLFSISNKNISKFLMKIKCVHIE
jgi:hypothetical protein